MEAVVLVLGLVDKAPQALQLLHDYREVVVSGCGDTPGALQ